MAIVEKYVTVTGGGLHDGTSESNAWTFTEALANAVAGDRVNVKLGTHPCNTASTTNGTYADPIYVRGYVSTIGDLDALPLGAMVGGTNIPLIQGTGNNIGFRGQWITFSHIEFQGTSAFSTAWHVATNSVARSCRYTSTSATSYTCVSTGRSVLQDCYVYSPTIYSTIVDGHASLVGCMVEGNNTGVRGANWLWAAINCVFKNLGEGVQANTSYSFNVHGCTFVNCLVGIRTLAYPYSYAISSCYFSGSTTGIIGGSSGSNNNSNILVNSCCYHNVTTQVSGIDFQYFASVDATDQFVDSAAGDYTLLPTSNGYNAMKPNVFAGPGTTTKRDIGAIQHADAGGGGVTNYNPFRNPVF